MPNIFDSSGRMEAKTVQFDSLKVGSVFVTFANQRAVVWTKIKEYEEGEDEWTCPEATAISIFDGFPAAIRGTNEVIRVHRDTTFLEEKNDG